MRRSPLARQVCSAAPNRSISIGAKGQGMASDPPRRDRLGQFCFWLHVAVLAFIAAGWALPWRGALLAYLIALPLVVAHWRINQDACVLNNLENLLRHGRWRAPEHNAEEGAWLRTLVRQRTGIALSPGRMNLLIYAAMALVWTLAAWRFLSFEGS